MRSSSRSMSSRCSSCSTITRLPATNTPPSSSFTRSAPACSPSLDGWVERWSTAITSPSSRTTPPSLKPRRCVIATSPEGCPAPCTSSTRLLQPVLDGQRGNAGEVSHVVSHDHQPAGVGDCRYSHVRVADWSSASLKVDADGAVGARRSSIERKHGKVGQEFSFDPLRERRSTVTQPLSAVEQFAQCDAGRGLVIRDGQRNPAEQNGRWRASQELT